MKNHGISTARAAREFARGRIDHKTAARIARKAKKAAIRKARKAGGK